MSGKIEISRELAEQALRFLMSPGDGWEAGQIAQELRAILAAPVVECQEPASVVLPTILSSEQGPHYSDNRTSELGYLAGYNACLDKFKELNQ